MMALGLYDATVPNFRQTLGALAGVLDKAETFCGEKGMPPEALIQARLFDDMLPFANQVQFAYIHSALALKGVMSGLLKLDRVAPPDTFAGLRSQISQARDDVESITAQDLNACAGRDVNFAFGDRVMPFTAEDFLFSFAQPNFYFHASTAYGILRNKGVPLGKGDFLGGLRLKQAG